MPDAVITDSVGKFLEAGPLAGLCVLLFAYIWWQAKQIREDAKEAREAMTKAKEAHAADLRAMNGIADDLKDGIAAIRSALAILQERIK